MGVPIELTFHGIDHSDAAAATVQRWVARLERVHERIERCVCHVNLPHKRHRHGAPFHITVTLDIPGKNVAVSHVGEPDVHVALAEAFRAARRQLLEQTAIRRGFVKRASGVARSSGRRTSALPARYAKL